MKICCLAIDDEPMALEIIKDYASKVPYMNLAGAFRNSIQAIEYLQQHTVELIFLDINMPDLSGIQFLNSLTQKPMIIFTTAYSEYAVESYNLDAVDYLLKPIEFDRFLKACNKAMEKYKSELKDKQRKPELKKESDHIIVKSGNDLHRIIVDDIQYIQSSGNYVVFFLPETRIMSLFSMNEVLNLLPAGRFHRIHKSFIISTRHITRIENHQVIIGRKKIPIGDVYRKNFLDAVVNQKN